MNQCKNVLSALLIFVSYCNCGKLDRKVDENVGSSDSNTHINYGYNIVVVSDLSNRIMNNRAFDDPQIVKLITSKLNSLFQESAELGINSKFYFTTFNNLDFAGIINNDSIFKIDLSVFRNNSVERAEYLHHVKGKGSLQYDIDVLNSEFNRAYRVLKTRKQLPADIWYYFKDKLAYPIIDTSSKAYFYKGKRIINKFKNYIIILTDGYIEADRYSDNKDMTVEGQYRFLSESVINKVRLDYKASGEKSFYEFFLKNRYGIIPSDNILLQNCKFLILELFDRSVKNGVNMENPTDQEIMTLFWRSWLEKSGIEKENILIYPYFTNKQNLDLVIQDFFKGK